MSQSPENPPVAPSRPIRRVQRRYARCVGCPCTLITGLGRSRARSVARDAGLPRGRATSQRLRPVPHGQAGQAGGRPLPDRPSQLILVPWARLLDPPPAHPPGGADNQGIVDHRVVLAGQRSRRRRHRRHQRDGAGQLPPGRSGGRGLDRIAPELAVGRPPRDAYRRSARQKAGASTMGMPRTSPRLRRSASALTT